jgi:hypothetical protein
MTTNDLYAFLTLKMQRPLPDSAFRIAARGEKKDGE